MRYTQAQQIVRKIRSLKEKGFNETSEKIIELNKELEKIRKNYFSSKIEIQRYPVKYFSNHKNDQNAVDLNEIFSLIKSKETIYGYFTKRRYQSEYKRNTYTPCGLFYGKNSTRKLNGIILLQLKGKPLIGSISQIIKSDNFTYAAYYEFEKKTTNIFVKAESINALNIAAYQKEIYKHYQRQFKNLVLTIPDFNITLSLTHDATLYCNENSNMFKI